MSTPYYKKLEKALLEHRYRYYKLDHPVISDFEYDFIERTYEAACREAGVQSILKEYGVDFQDNHPDYQAAKFRVDNNLDRYSLWELMMAKTWERLGRPKEHYGKEK